MNGQELIERFVAQTGVDKERADRFYKEFFQVLVEGLEKDGYVRVKGLGSFKLLVVERRESININTGERFEIQGHNRISFTPEPGLKELVNKPFAHLETVVLEAGGPLAAAAAVEETAPEIEAETVESEKETVVADAEAVKSVESEGIKEKEAEEGAVAVSEPASTPATAPVERKQVKDESPVWIKVAGWIMLVVFVLCVIALLMLYVPGLRKLLFEKHLKEAMETEMQIEASAAEKLPDVETETVAPAAENMAVASITVKTTVEPTVESATTSAQRVPATAIAPDSVNYDIVGTQAEYTIGEGETLARVALHFYGTKALWPYIVKYNAAIIPNPDRVTSGLRVRIPRLQKKGG